MTDTLFYPDRNGEAGMWRKLFTRRPDKVDLALVFCPVWIPHFPNIGLGSVDRFLRSLGYTTAVLDFNIELYQATSPANRFLWKDDQSFNWFVPDLEEPTYARIGLNLEAMARRIIATGAPLVGFSIHSANQFMSERLARKVRELAPEKIIIWGGPHYYFPHDLQRADPALVDAVVIGEGEIPLGELVSLFLTGVIPTAAKQAAFPVAADDPAAAGGQDRVLGAQYTYRGERVPYRPSPYLVDLNRIPHPDYRGFPLDRYPSRTLSIMTSRGCQYQCRFCCDHVRGGYLRSRRPEAVAEEIAYAIETLGRQALVIHDSAINGNPEYMEELCRLLVARRLAIPWQGNVTPSRQMTPEMIRLMRQAGCFNLCYGLESASDRVLALMQKPFRGAEAERVVRATAQAGIETKINVIVGFPGETVADHRLTLEFIERNRRYLYAISALNTCDLLVGCWLWENRHRTLTRCDDGNLPDWELNDLTLAERRRRLKEVADLARRLQLPIEMNNQPDLYSSA